jgi:hypothetical protein
VLRFARFGSRRITDKQNQVAAKMCTQQAMQKRTQRTIGAPATVARASYAAILNPRQAGRGFFVGYSFYFGFFGYRQMPARAGARTLLE